MSRWKKHSLAVYDGKYMYYRKDFVIEALKDLGKSLASDFERAYVDRNIVEPSKEGKDVDVRLEKSIAKMNAKNIRHACEYASEYFKECSREPNKKEIEKANRK
jgi:hypothetical protein